MDHPPELTYPNYSGGQRGPLAPPSDPLVPANFGGWFDRVVGVIRRSGVLLLLIQVGVAVVNAIFGIILVQLTVGVVASSGSSAGVLGLGLLSVVVAMVVNVFAQGASIFVAIRDAAGETTSLPTALGFAAGRALPLLGWGLVAGIMMVVGFVLFVVPGVYLAIVFTATLTGVVAVERMNIGRCFQLVNRRFWPTAGRLLLAFLMGIIYSAVVNGIVYVVTGPNLVAATALRSILTIPLGLAFVAVAVVTYAELRFHESPTVLTPTLAAELRR
jgi:hypothetical protein